MKEEDDGAKVQHLGFLAQELEQAFPEVVRESAAGTKMVNYAGLVPVLTKAIQEQQKIIEKQQQQIDWLMKKVQ
jgi:trimeric autotransporter adhesin